MGKKFFLIFFCTFCLAAIVLLWSSNRSQNIKNKAEVQKILYQRDSLQKSFDSLMDVKFSLEVELGRCDLSIEYLRRVDPETAKKVEYYYSHETE